jgi:uncharacterized protein (DUF305 family)
MNKKNIFIGVLIAVVFFVAGSYHGVAGKYSRKHGGEWSGKYSNPSQQMHTMGDGKMMHNNEPMGGMNHGGAGKMNMQQMMDSMMGGIDGKTGNEFDKAFLSEMIAHHQGAVLMAEAVLKNSKRPELIEFAKAIIAVQTKEINTMKGWEAEWSK